MSHKLLLADDSITIQRVIELTFADEDVTVSAVGDGQQAIERIEADPPDIVLADVGMPKRDGYDVATYVKSRPALAHIPVVLLTGAFEPVDQARAAAAGCDGVLAKPFEPQMVINRVKQLLGGEGASTRKRPAPAGQAPRAVGPVPRGVDRHVAAAAHSSVRGDVDVELSLGPQMKADTNVSLDDYFDQLDAAFAEFDKPVGEADEAASAGPHVPEQPGDLTFTERDLELARPVAAPSGDLLPPKTTPSAAPAGLHAGAADDEVDDWLDGGEPKPGTAAGSLDFSDLPGLEVRTESAPTDGGSNNTMGAGLPAPAGPAPASASPKLAAGAAAPVVQVPAEPPAIADAFAALFDAEVGDFDVVEEVAPEPPPVTGPADETGGAAASDLTPALRAPTGALITEELIEAVVRRVIARMSDDVVRQTAAALLPEIAERLVREELMKIKGRS